MQTVLTSRLTYVLTLTTVYWLAASPNSYSQCESSGQLEVVNPGFEGPPSPHQLPLPWDGCGVTPDTQPGSWGVVLPPSEGSSYVGLIHDGGSWQEGASQELSDTMHAGETQVFTIDLSATTASGGGINPDSYCSLQVWGGNSPCNKEELLWVSPVVEHHGWETYQVQMEPGSDWNYIYLVSDCEPMGCILVDNMSSIENVNNYNFITSHVYNDEVSCSFEISGTLTEPGVDSVIVTGGFAESPMNATITGTEWTAPISYPSSGTQSIVATAYLPGGQQTSGCGEAAVELSVTGPTAHYNLDVGCMHDTASAWDVSSSFGTDSIVSWTWLYGADTIGTESTVSILPPLSEPEILTLQISAESGCLDTTSAALDPLQPPTADFAFTEVCVGDLTEFTDQTVSGDTSVVDWFWSLGDGNATLHTFPVHTYDSAGTYPVQLIASDENGCSDTLVQLVEVLLCTSIDDKEHDNVLIYPNPSGLEELHIRALNGSQLRRVQLVDTRGRTVKQKQLEIWSDDHSLNLSGLATGTYVLVLTTAENIEFKRQILIQ